MTEIGPEYPRIGGLLLTPPLVGILTFVMAWTIQGDLQAISALAKETFILEPLGLPFFIPLALADRLDLSFWSAKATSFLSASATIGVYFWFSMPVSK